MKNLRNLAIAFALTALAAAAAVPAVNAGDHASKGTTLRAAVPVAQCSPGVKNGCGIYD